MKTEDRRLWVCGCWELCLFGSLDGAAVTSNCWQNNCVRLVVVSHTHTRTHIQIAFLANAYLNERTETKIDPITLCRLAEGNFTIQLTHALNTFWPAANSRKQSNQYVCVLYKENLIFLWSTLLGVFYSCTGANAAILREINFFCIGVHFLHI